METLTIIPAPSITVRPAELAVVVDGQVRQELHVLWWRQLPGPEFGQAEFALAMAGAGLPERRFQDVQALPSVGSRIQIHANGLSGALLFDGLITQHKTQLDQHQEQLGLLAQEFLAVRLSPRISGRWQESDGAAVFSAAGQCVFNDDRHGLASAAGYTIRYRLCRVFHDGPDGQLWSVADILQCLLAAYAPVDVLGPSSAELQRLAGAIYPPRVNLANKPLGEAIAHVAGLAGLAVRGSQALLAGRIVRGLSFYQPGRMGRARSIRLQPAGQGLDLSKSSLWKGQICLGRRPGRRGVIVQGALKRYEVTLELKPAWLATQESYEHRRFIRGEASDWPAVAEVYRKWVLNESGQYCAAPWNLPAYNFAGVSGQDFLLKIARPLAPCLSRDSSGRSRGIYVQLSYDNGTTWRQYGGPVRAGADECSLHLADDALPADYFQACQDHAIRLRVTATLTSDRRVSHQLNGDYGCGNDVIELPRCGWAKVHAGSIFYGQPEGADEADGAARLVQLASRASQVSGNALQAELTLGLLDAGIGVGDLVRRVDGRGLELACVAGSLPHVTAVEHRAHEEWMTHLKVSG